LGDHLNAPAQFIAALLGELQCTQNTWQLCGIQLKPFACKWPC